MQKDEEIASLRDRVLQLSKLLQYQQPKLQRFVERIVIPAITDH